MPAPAPLADQPAALDLAIPGDEVSIVAAAETDPVFAEVTPDDFSAYVRTRFAHCIPVILGPESISGAVFCLHPATVARAYKTAIHKQMNRDHQVKYLGAKNDAIVGCVLQVAFPEEPDTGWDLSLPEKESPHISAQAVLWKKANGVDKMMGDHLSGKKKMSVSMEMSFFHTQTGIWDRQAGEVYDRHEIPQGLKGYLFEDKDGRLLIRKGPRAATLIPVFGGKTGALWFSGLGYTASPAEKTAAIDSIAASVKEGLVVCSSAACLEWMPGMVAQWTGGWGTGRVAAVHYEGVHRMHGMSLTATEADPLLHLKLPSGQAVLRRASSVSKKIQQT